MAPTVCRIVHYFPAEGDTIAAQNNNEDGPVAGIITRVHGDRCINLTLFPDFPGGTTHKTSVMQATTPREPGCWDWPVTPIMEPVREEPRPGAPAEIPSAFGSGAAPTPTPEGGEDAVPSSE